MKSHFPSQKELKKQREALKNCPASRPLSKTASVVQRVKFRICEQFVIYKNSHGLTSQELAQKIPISPTVMNQILHYHFDDLTVDQLVEYLARIYSEVDLKFDVA